jgi:hypothetical protein
MTLDTALCSCAVFSVEQQKTILKFLLSYPGQWLDMSGICPMKCCQEFTATKNHRDHLTSLNQNTGIPGKMLHNTSIESLAV